MAGTPVIRFIVLSMLIFLMPHPAGAADPLIQDILPVTECSKGWRLEERVTLYDRENLFDYINGEAELYLPYGFEAAAAARYVRQGNPDEAIAADVYRMASLLDAFGIYANYRKAASPTSGGIGAEGFLSSTQLMFYQDRYVVRLQASGVTGIEKDVFLDCARILSRNLPSGAGRPAEVELLRVPGVVPGTERYIPRSLLGYAFLRRGVIADAVAEGERIQVFVVLEDSKSAARKAFDDYHAYLQTSGKDVRSWLTGGRIFLSAVDPLYGGVLVEPSGRCVVGAIRAGKISSAEEIVKKLSEKAGSR